jgi:hypothetical protein
MSLSYSWVVKEPKDSNELYYGVNPPSNLLTDVKIVKGDPKNIVFFRSRSPYAAEYYISKYKTLGTTIGTGTRGL